MRTKPIFIQIKALVVIAMILYGAGLVMAQQKPRLVAGPRVVELGKGMSLLTADLMQIAAQSDLFLRFAAKIDLSKDQQTKLEEMYFEIQSYMVRRQADLDVADAEIRRLVTNENVDLGTVRAKVREMDEIETEATMNKIETILRAIKILTHGQHIRVMLLVRELQNQVPPTGNTDGGF